MCKLLERHSKHNVSPDYSWFLSNLPWTLHNVRLFILVLSNNFIKYGSIVKQALRLLPNFVT